MWFVEPAEELEKFLTASEGDLWSEIGDWELKPATVAAVDRGELVRLLGTISG